MSGTSVLLFLTQCPHNPTNQLEVVREGQDISFGSLNLPAAIFHYVDVPFACHPPFIVWPQLRLAAGAKTVASQSLAGWRLASGGS